MNRVKSDPTIYERTKRMASMLDATEITAVINRHTKPNREKENADWSLVNLGGTEKK